MAKVESGVFPCYENQFAVGKAGTESATTNIANCEEFSAFENEGWKSRLMTAKYFCPSNHKPQRLSPSDAIVILPIGEL